MLKLLKCLLLMAFWNNTRHDPYYMDPEPVFGIQISKNLALCWRSSSSNLTWPPTFNYLRGRASKAGNCHQFKSTIGLIFCLKLLQSYFAVRIKFFISKFIYLKYDYTVSVQNPDIQNQDLSKNRTLKRWFQVSENQTLVLD